MLRDSATPGGGIIGGGACLFNVTTTPTSIAASSTCFLQQDRLAVLAKQVHLTPWSRKWQKTSEAQVM